MTESHAERPVLVFLSCATRADCFSSILLLSCSFFHSHSKQKAFLWSAGCRFSSCESNDDGHVITIALTALCVSLLLFRYVIVPFCETCCPSDKLANFITWLGYINSALNPLIYTVFNIEYRRAFKKLLGIKA